MVPVDNEFTLRNRAWEEDNRRKVDELSGGKLAYVHVPDTAVGGYTTSIDSTSRRWTSRLRLSMNGTTTGETSPTTLSTC